MTGMLALYIYGLVGCIGGGVMIGWGDKVAGFLLWFVGFGITLYAVMNGAFE